MKNVENYLFTKLSGCVVIAVSGGPDSMALLNLVIETRKKININIIVAHVNHNVRHESESEKNFVKNFCKQKNIIFEYMKIEKYNHDNFHNEARNKRYDFFENVIKKYDAKFLLTAHHADDLIETVLMRITRGSTFKGYGGIRKEQQRAGYILLRPLIEVNKESILKYLSQHNIKYVIDASNLKDDYTRNRYRNHIIPELKKENLNIYKSFNKFSNIVFLYFDFVVKETEKIYNLKYKKNYFLIDDFNNLEFLIQYNFLLKIFEDIYKDNIFLIKEKHLEIIFDMIKNKNNSVKINLPDNIIVSKENKKIIFYKKENPKKYCIELIDTNKLNNGKVIEKIKNSELDNNFICRLDLSEISLPLYIRSRENGDKILLKGLNKYKKISDIFINEKVSSRERNSWPIVVDSENNIVWLPGLKKSKFDRTKNEKYDIILRYY